jgi:hypothetical protein
LVAACSGARYGVAVAMFFMQGWRVSKVLGLAWGELDLDDRFDASASVTVCAFTTDPTDAPLIRLLVEADEVTGIRESSRLMVNKITTISRQSP